MNDNYEFKKLIKSYCDDMTKRVMQVFELMANQLRGKLKQGVVEVSIMERHIIPFILNKFFFLMYLGTTRNM